ncbi:hypothetical protein M0805_002625 [Coniferiporia weirii]|nr:hypothetical protein M0805_002625 [Coniferiporia weirii]
MSIRDRVAKVLGFKTLPVTVLTVLVYAAIYLAITFTDEPPAVPAPKDQHGLNIDRAYSDLHKIAGLPHPYNSHQNDVVRDYILERVQAVALSSDFVFFDDDLTSNVTFGLKTGLGNDAGAAAYFEGSNILVKIDGTQHDSKSGAVLFSAHFDSVSTAPGATDDGMGVATLLALVEYFAENRPKRTVVFNINNGEEDGLYGAHAFLEHPWSKLTKDFINLEGAGAGGRPLLLRATSTRHVRAWRRVPHPHGLVMSADAFSRGLVRSATDYGVYAAAGLGGLDFSFYRQRSKYHTREDAIPALGGKAALWSMMESTLLAGLALINDDDIGAERNSTPVYFDLFGEALAVATLKTFFSINIALLVTGPIVVASLIFAAHKTNKLYWPAKGWGRSLSSLVVGSGLTVGLGILYARVNPFIIYSSGTAVFISMLSLAFFSFYAVSELFSFFLPVPQQRSMGFLECYVFWWILLIVDTVFIDRDQIGGLYFVTFFHAGALAALLIGLLEHFELPSALGGGRRIAFAIDNDYGDNESDTERAESSERTPLLTQNGRTIRKKDIDEDNEMGLWIVQFLLMVPFPVILITQIAVMLLNALPQTLADGNSATTVYLAVSLLSVLSFVPLLPFVHKLHGVLPLALFVVLVVSVLYSALAFPFSVNSPLKLYFQQAMNLDLGTNTVRLTGARPWLDGRIVPELPSSWNSNTTCGLSDSIRQGLPSCTWSGLEPHVAPSDSPSEWLKLNATQTAPGIGLLSIQGMGTRNCRIYFERPATTVGVRGAAEDVQKGFPMPSGGMSELRLWSRTWERTFEVSVAWDTSDTEEGESGLKGHVACEWAEADGLPALEEVVAFLPGWARVSKRTDGLLEGYKTFSMH